MLPEHENKSLLQEIMDEITKHVLLLLMIYEHSLLLQLFFHIWPSCLLVQHGNSEAQ